MDLLICLFEINKEKKIMHSKFLFCFRIFLCSYSRNLSLCWRAINFCNVRIVCSNPTFQKLTIHFEILKEARSKCQGIYRKKKS